MWVWCLSWAVSVWGGWWVVGEGVDEYGEGEREGALGGSLCGPGEGLGEVGLHPHLALQGGEHGLDHEGNAGLRDLGSWTLSEFVFVGDDHVDVDELEAVVVLTVAVPGVGERECAAGCAVRGRELIDALALVLIRCSEVIPERRAS
jgi:hypothetical protein